MKERGATRQLWRFEAFCDRSQILDIDGGVLDLAADLWVVAHRAGLPRRDADLIIAATALVNDRVLVTGNVKHFSWISGLKVEDWRQP